MADYFRIQLLCFEAVPSAEQVLTAVGNLAGVKQVLLARVDDASSRAGMWTRDPLGMLPTGRIAIEVNEPTSRVVLQQLEGSFSASAYLCKVFEPLAIGLKPGETFDGTLQLCCFQRQPMLSDEDLKQYWLGDHTHVALETQSTQGYYQNWVLHSGQPNFDGIVEEYFPPAAADTVEVFFAATGNPEQLQAHIKRMTTSTSRFINLAAAEVIHLTETRIL